jgi:hypothetical protein
VFEQLIRYFLDTALVVLQCSAFAFVGEQGFCKAKHRGLQALLLDMVNNTVLLGFLMSANRPKNTLKAFTFSLVRNTEHARSCF